MLNVREKIRSLTESLSEENNLIRFVKSCNLGYGSKIMDVGCFYGKYTVTLEKIGYKVLGVDINPNILNKNKEAGLDCLTVEEFQSNFAP